MPAGLVTISKPRRALSEGRQRITATVAGQEVWFESQDYPLRPSMEAFGSAFLIPALHQRAGLQLEMPVCPTWQEGAVQAGQLASRWWRLSPQPLRTTLLAEPLGKIQGRTALCFTGGIDSFHSLLHGQHRPDLLVFVHGYDIELADDVRLRNFVASLKTVAAHFGCGTAVVRTNLRSHPLLRSAPWTQTHGGALAAVGHLLGEHVSRFVIASSVPRDYGVAWGSHWQLDPLWSSDSVAILHDGDAFPREQKAWAIAADPLVRDHLRVCWENRTPTGNCSVCDKCVNAMLLLQQMGQLANSTVFQPPASFVPLLDALPETTFVRVYRAICRRGLPTEEAAAVQRLLRRTERCAARRAVRARIRRAFDALTFRR